MIHVTKEFLEHLKTERSFEFSARIILADGRVLDLSEDDLELAGCSITSGMDSEELIVGNAVSRRLELAFYNPNDKFMGYDFYMAKVYPSMIFWLTEEDGETIDFGEYTVAEPEGYGTTITLTAYDALWQADKAFAPGNLAFPTTAQNLFEFCCNSCSLSGQVDPIPNGNFEVKKAANNVSFRQVFGGLAMLGGGNAVIKDGRVTILSYQADLLDRPFYDGGYFGEPDIPYTSGDDLDGLYFTDLDTVEVADAEFHGYEAHSFTEPYKGASVGTDDVVITGISTSGEVEVSVSTTDPDGQIETITETQEQTFTYGTEGYILQVENPVLDGNWEDGIERIGNILIGIRFRPFEVSVPCYPLAEIGDCCYTTDVFGRQYLSFVTEIDFPFHRATKLKCSASDPVRNTSNYYANNAVVKAIKMSRAEMSNALARYEVELQRMSGIVANALGFYETRDMQADGSVIVYLHNKVTLASSDIIWKRTSAGMVVSTNGGQTWNAGIDAQGNAVLNMLSVKGIQWDWAKGGTLTLGGLNNTHGTMYIKDGSGNVVGRWDKDGIYAIAGTIGGWIANEHTLYAYANNAQTGNVRRFTAFQEPGNGTWAIAVGLTSNSDWTTAPFRVNHKGQMVAADADITGKITANSGDIAGFTLSNSSNTGSTSAGGHCYTRSLYAHTSDTNYEYEVGLKGDTGTGSAAFYIARIAKGSTWSTRTLIYYVTNGGTVHSGSDIESTGTITSSDGVSNGKRTVLTESRINLQYGSTTVGQIRPGQVKLTDDRLVNGMGIIYTGSCLALSHSANIDTSAGIYRVLFNNGANPEGFTDPVIFIGAARFKSNINAHNEIRIGPFGSNYDAHTNRNHAKISYYTTSGGSLEIGIRMDYLIVDRDLSVYGTKSRVVDTEYGNIKMYAFETASCHFADVGSGTVGEDGKVYIYFDPVFSETIDQKAEYQVLITRTSQAVTEWVEKKAGYFIAHGEPGATFDWMLVGYQRNYTMERHEQSGEDHDRADPDDGEPIAEDDTAAVDLLTNAFNEYEKEIDLL